MSKSLLTIFSFQSRFSSQRYPNKDLGSLGLFVREFALWKEFALSSSLERGSTRERFGSDRTGLDLVRDASC